MKCSLKMNFSLKTNQRAAKLLVGIALGILVVAPARATAPPTGANAPSVETYRADSDLTNREITTKELPLGDLVADAVRSAAQSDAAFVHSAVFAETPVTLSRMGFTLADLLRTVEYKDDNIAIVKLTGVQVRDALENSLYLYPNPNGALLQTSGLVTSFNPAAQAGKRVLSVKINGATLENGKSYRVAMPMALAHGAQGYFKYWKKADIVESTEIKPINVETAMTNYLNQHKIIAKGEDRLVATTK